ncbi:hypothetical protein JMF89_06905 [Clostridiaceae bacterium UIB06]|uniref:Uncharacterized protein n=1 Tax=Clostridium thailandense TaxID=2794346 RepID=A0A949TJB7_9CLOT|nr:hypothetical protein [Clostridium thailandense]MBV7273894.1 hypothetical protein [Clostridium thailandense]MCH5136929.1 hypothetical protein [Clostridiaceae bacterium UIB06]
MEKYDNLYFLIENIEAILESILISGFNVVNTGSIKAAEEVAENCENIGLVFAADMLKEIAKAQETKRHDINYTNRDIIEKYFLLNNYVQIVKSKLEVEKARGCM